MMQSIKLLVMVAVMAVVGAVVEGLAVSNHDAIVQHDNLAATYMAVLPLTLSGNGTNSTNSTDSMSITGSVTGMANLNGTGIRFLVNFQGMSSDAESGSLVYSIHDKPVPADGNCAGTMGQLDPTDVGKSSCNNEQPATCQAGDLAGKHGTVTGNSFTASFLDLYLSTIPDSPYFFGDKSIVISSGTTPLTCANFTLTSAVGPTTTKVATSSSTPTRRRRRSP